MSFRRKKTKTDKLEEELLKESLDNMSLGSFGLLEFEQELPETRTEGKLPDGSLLVNFAEGDLEKSIVWTQRLQRDLELEAAVLKQRAEKLDRIIFAISRDETDAEKKKRLASEAKKGKA